MSNPAPSGLRSLMVTIGYDSFLHHRYENYSLGMYELEKINSESSEDLRISSPIVFGISSRRGVWVSCLGYIGVGPGPIHVSPNWAVRNK